MFKRLKVKFTLNQLVGSSLFMGYNKKDRNPRSNYFLLGEIRGDDILNLQLSMTLIKKYLSLLVHFFESNCRVWVINSSFDLFPMVDSLVNLSTFSKRIKFFTDKFIAGSFTN